MVDFIILTPKEINAIVKLSDNQHNIILKSEQNGIGSIIEIIRQIDHINDDFPIYEDITDYESW